MIATATLARWLGPWADATRAPQVPVVDDALADLRVRVYGDRARHRAAYLVAPGLHYAGPDDPRMDRFCRILAAAGHLVIAPFIPSYLALIPDDAAKRDFARVFAARSRWTAKKPIVFSISFGSLLAFALAAEHGADIDKLVIFGGYRDLPETLRFCLTGQVEGGRAAIRDPLNQPVVLLNLLADLAPAISLDDRSAVAAAWRGYVRRTWGRAEMKVDRAFVPIAEELAPAVPAHLRELFLVGVGALPGADTLAADALTRFDAAALDPTPYLRRITNRVELVHGADDDVIPYEHSHALAGALTAARVRVHVTGMYGHTGVKSPKVSAMAKELVTMLRVLRVLAG
jgi:pimeloyl-ACP methyl ester carboxylesterase